MEEDDCEWRTSPEKKRTDGFLYLKRKDTKALARYRISYSEV